MSERIPVDRGAVENDVARALAEDLGSGDVSAALVPDHPTTEARLLAREACVLAGRPWFEACFRALDPAVVLHWNYVDGDRVAADAEVVRIRGRARALLSAERSALNFLQTLSATATQTARYVERIRHTRCRILDTRKTLPGLRQAQKYAVRCGGGHNHRLGLYDAFLIKENHIAAAGSIGAAVRAARAHAPRLPLEVEVETLEQLDECLALAVPRVLLDNFDLDGLRAAVARAAGRIELEASGAIDETSVVAYAETGVDFISIGALTKHVRAIDFSLRIVATTAAAPR